MKKQDKIDPIDWSKVPVDPDPGFSADHNREIIERTIKKNEVNRRLKKKEYDALLKERTTAVAQYLKSVQMGGNSNVAKYFGRSELTRLRGKEIQNKIREAHEEKQKESQAQKVHQANTKGAM